jgi:hypothetical protein
MEAVNGLPGVADRLEVGTDRRAVRHARRAQRSRPTFPPSPNPARPALLASRAPYQRPQADL